LRGQGVEMAAAGMKAITAEKTPPCEGISTATSKHPSPAFQRIGRSSGGMSGFSRSPRTLLMGARGGTGLEFITPAAGRKIDVIELAYSVFLAYRGMGGTQGRHALVDGLQVLRGIIEMQTVPAAFVSVVAAHLRLPSMALHPAHLAPAAQCAAGADGGVLMGQMRPVFYEHQGRQYEP
jgi:hypothetical protein